MNFPEDIVIHDIFVQNIFKELPAIMENNSE